MMRLLVCLLVVVSQCHAEPDTYNSFTNRRLCWSTRALPSKPNALSFCNVFNDLACSFPGTDADANEQFNSLFSNGLSCRLRGDVRSHPLAKFGCIVVDPKQPRYVRNVDYTSLITGCPTPKTNIVPNNSTYPVQLNKFARDKVLLIDATWAVSQFSPDPSSPLGIISKCGVHVSSPCLDALGNQIPNRDPYTCGDGDMLPNSWLLADDKTPLTSAQIVEAFLNQDGIGSIHISDDYAFRVIDCNSCGADYIGSPADDPSCARSAEQLFRIYKTGNLSDYSDELCFNSASALLHSKLLLAMLLCVFLGFVFLV